MKKYLEAASVPSKVNYDDWQAKQKLYDDMDNLARMDNYCPDIYFAGDFDLDLSKMEQETHEAANDAIEHFCDRMENDGKPIWEQPGVMPRNSVCKSNWKMTERRKARGKHRYFTCYDLMRMSNEEIGCCQMVC